MSLPLFSSSTAVIELGWVPMLRVRIGGKPVGAQRPRAVVRGRHAATYTADAHREAEAGIVALARVGWGSRAAHEGPVRVEIVIVAPRPQRLCRVKDPAHRLPFATCKPDGDNVEKLVWDGLVKAGVIVDDTQVCSWGGERLYAAKGEGPCTEVVVSRWGSP